MRQIRRENERQYQKWLLVLRETLGKIGISFIWNFLLKARVLTISKWNRLVCLCLVLPECLSVKICCTSPADSEANLDGADAESPFRLFFSFSATLKNSSKREKVGNLSPFWDWWAKSLFVSIIVVKYGAFPSSNNGLLREKKKYGQAICWRYQRALSRFRARLRVLNLIARLCQLFFKRISRLKFAN